MTDLDRVRELAPLIAASLRGAAFVHPVIALRHRARELGVEVVHGRFTGDDDSDTEIALTLLLAPTGALVGVVELDADRAPILLRPDAGLRQR